MIPLSARLCENKQIALPSFAVRWHTRLPQHGEHFTMKREYHRWHSPRLGLATRRRGLWPLGATRWMGFPTSGRRRMGNWKGRTWWARWAEFIDAGRIKFYNGELD